jgi:hypothetical protein
MLATNHRTASVAQWLIAAFALVMAIGEGLEADWNGSGTFGTLALAHVLLASGWTERDMRAKVLTWAALAVSVGMFVARRGFGIGAASA